MSQDAITRSRHLPRLKRDARSRVINYRLVTAEPWLSAFDGSRTIPRCRASANERGRGVGAMRAVSSFIVHRDAEIVAKAKGSARGSVNTKHSLAYRLKRNLYSVRLPRPRGEEGDVPGRTGVGGRCREATRTKRAEAKLRGDAEGGRATSGVAGGRVGSTAQRARGPPLIDLCSGFSSPL